MTLKEVLDNYNVEGKPYLSDIELWLGEPIDPNKAREIQEHLMELKNV